MSLKSKKSFLARFLGGLVKFITTNKAALSFALKFVILKILKHSAMGGVAGWVVKTVVTEFTEEVIDTIRVTVKYVEIRTVTSDTVDMENRDEATTTLNDIMR